MAPGHNSSLVLRDRHTVNKQERRPTADMRSGRPSHCTAQSQPQPSLWPYIFELKVSIGAVTLVLTNFLFFHLFADNNIAHWQKLFTSIFFSLHYFPVSSSCARDKQTYRRRTG